MKPLQWYALYTKPRHEKKVETELVKKEILCYLPMRKTLKKWSDRKKWIEEPLFRGYIFVHGDNMVRFRAVQTPGVVRAVMFQRKWAVVRDEEIEMVQKILREVDDVEAGPQLSIGEEVEIQAGPLTGMRGRLEAFQGGHRLIMDIGSIRQSIRFTVDLKDVRKIR